ncbi:hypothetical protein, partial [Burkholderia ubonensis]|uniref:hypothetical protein n=1 Tax=Burkholderia ubonensis TaxID=101571 RepID=UPI000A8CE3A0
RFAWLQNRCAVGSLTSSARRNELFRADYLGEIWNLMGLGELNRSGICVHTRVSRATVILSVPAVHGRYAADIDWALTRVRCV